MRDRPHEPDSPTEPAQALVCLLCMHRVADACVPPASRWALRHRLQVGALGGIPLHLWPANLAELIPTECAGANQAKAAEALRQRREMGAMGGMPYSPPYSPGRSSMSGRRASLSDTPLEGMSLLLVEEVPCSFAGAQISAHKR